MAQGISDEDIQKVRGASDLVAIVGERVPLRQRGRDFWCCCPFHQEKTPSCKVDPSTQMWHCFGCGEGGDVFSFVMKSDGITFPEAVRQLAERAHIELANDGRDRAAASRRGRLKEVCAETERFYHVQLMRNPADDAARARTYLAARGMGGEVPKRWSLGFAPGSQQLVRHLRGKGFSPKDMIEANVAVEGRDGRGVRDRFFNRVMFPIHDAQGDCIAFGGRVIGTGEPKYLNSQETPLFHKSRVLYGLDKAKAALASTGVAVIVEGYTDVIALHESGIENVVATLGTALTLNHIRTLSRHARRRIVYLFDGDAAGKRAADRALAFIDESMTPEAGRNRVDLAAVTLPDDLDPADFVAERGADALRALIEDAQPLLTYGIERRLSRWDLSSAEERMRAADDALSVLAPIKDSLLAKDYAVQIAGHVRAREADVLERLAHLKAPRRFAQASDDERPASPAGAPAAPSASLSEAESNRRRVEREFLSICAINPSVGLDSVRALVGTSWHDPLHARVADAMTDELVANPKVSSAALVSTVATKVPSAAGLLTSGMESSGSDPDALARFLAEELEIGDLEDDIADIRSQLMHPDALPEGGCDLMFESAASLQKVLGQRRADHKMSL